jgi:hypothetical protein
MRPCPRCGAESIISNPHGPTTWVENCSACGYESGGTASFVTPEVADDDWPILSVCVVDPGPQRPRLFQLYREILGASPKQAKTLLSTARVEVARGSRMEIEPYIDKFRAVGATLDVSLA